MTRAVRQAEHQKIYEERRALVRKLRRGGLVGVVYRRGAFELTVPDAEDVLKLIQGTKDLLGKIDELRKEKEELAQMNQRLRGYRFKARPRKELT